MQDRGRVPGVHRGVASCPTIFQQVLLIELHTPRRRRRPCGLETAAHRPAPPTSPPARSALASVRAGIGRSGSARARRRARGWPPIPRPPDAIRKRACRIGVASEASWLPITPMRFPESASTTPELDAVFGLRCQLISRYVGLLLPIGWYDASVGYGGVDDLVDGLKVGGGVGAEGGHD